MPGRLTDREFTVWWLIYRGMSNQEIGRRMGIGVSAVKNYVGSLFGKRGFACRSQAAVAMFRELQEI